MIQFKFTGESQNLRKAFVEELNEKGINWAEPARAPEIIPGYLFIKNGTLLYSSKPAANPSASYDIPGDWVEALESVHSKQLKFPNWGEPFEVNSHGQLVCGCVTISRERFITLYEAIMSGSLDSAAFDLGGTEVVYNDNELSYDGDTLSDDELTELYDWYKQQ